MKREDMILIAVIAVILFIIFYRNSASFKKKSAPDPAPTCKQQDTNSAENFLSDPCRLYGNKKGYKFKISYEDSSSPGTPVPKTIVLDTDAVERKKGASKGFGENLTFGTVANGLTSFTVTNVEFRCDCYPDKMFKLNPSNVKIYKNDKYVSNGRMNKLIQSTDRNTKWGIRFD